MGANCRPRQLCRRNEYYLQNVTSQTISGTGALRVGAAFVAAWSKGPRAVYLPTPSWGNHAAILKAAGLEVRSPAG